MDAITTPRSGRWLWLATVSLAAACFTLLIARPACAQQEAAGPRTKTESPYFFVKSDDPARRPAAAEGHRGRRAGSPASSPTSRVTQHYRNEGQRPIEARYVFPGSTRAAVAALNVRLGDRLITAQIREKQQARIEYDTAKKEGKTAALLEQHLPNVFQMNVANILPGDDVKVELRYTELLVPQGGNYQFVFPTVVGPALQQPAVGATPAPGGWRNRRCARPWRRAPTFKLKVSLDTPMGIKEVRSATHAIDVQAARRRRTCGHLARRDVPSPPTTATSCSTTASPATRIESGLMLYKGQGDERRELLPRDGRAAEGGGRQRDHAARLHLRGRHLGLDARLSARHGQGAAASG